MRLSLLTAFVFAFCTPLVNAQTQPLPDKCRTVENHARLQQKYPGQVPSTEAFEQWMSAQRLAAASQRTGADEVLLIPTVIHIIHNGEAAGVGINVPDAQIASQIKRLNDDFRRRPGTRGFFNNPDAIDTKIEFVLARRDPQGRATNGINRVNRRTINAQAPPYDETDYIDSVIKARTVWNADEYFNVWVMPTGGLFGYAQFPPLTGLLGVECEAGPASTDGVVLNTTAFGSVEDGPFTLDPYSNYGRTASHEIGHYLSLRHIWGDAQCGNDYCDDTPVHRFPNRGCPTHPKPNQCGTTDEQFENYMDYIDDACAGMFTRDQSIRMRTTLLNGPRRQSLLSSLALVPPQRNDVGITAIVSPVADDCETTVTPRLVIKNQGTANLTSATLRVYIDGQRTTETVRLNLALGESDTIETGPRTLAPGEHTLALRALQPNNLPDSARQLDSISATFTIGTGVAMPVVENFNSADYLPRNWRTSNIDNDCVGWSLQSARGPFGDATTALAMRLNVYNPGLGQRDETYLPLLNLSADTSAYLTFYVAHRSRGNVANLTNLRIEASTDCGQTWLPTPVWEKSGTALATTQANLNAFVPSQAAQWRREVVNLAALAGYSVRIRFVLVNNGGGNNLYVDNVSLSAARLQAPLLVALSPDSGVVGDTISLQGTRLSGVTRVAFGGARMGRIVPGGTDSQLRVVVPAGARTARVTATNAEGSSTSSQQFKVLNPPTLYAFSPGFGQVGSRILITGLGFNQVSLVTFNDVLAPFTLDADSALTATVPAGATSGLIRLYGRLGQDSSRKAFLIGNYVAMSGQSLSTCNAVYQDPGGFNNTPNDADITQTITPATAGNYIRADFRFIDLEADYDSLMVFDGINDQAPMLANFSGNYGAVSLQATNPAGALTFVFRSDRNGNGDGWEAQLSCRTGIRPEIVNLTPDSGAWNAKVVIQGILMDRIDSVFFGTKAAAFTVLSPTELEARVPVDAVSGYVYIMGTAGGDTSAKFFRVLNGYDYCSVEASNCTPTTPYLKLVVLEGTALHNTTFCGSGTGSPAYTRYAPQDSLTATLLRGTLVTLTTTTNLSGRVAAWLDLDRSGTFDSTEAFIAAASNITNRPASITLTIPVNAKPGIMGLRVRSRSLSGQWVANGACAVVPVGETEDYMITLSSVVATRTPLARLGVRLQPNPARSQVQLTVPSAATVIVRDIMGRSQRRHSLAAGTHTLPLTGLARGTYLTEVITQTGRAVEVLVVE